MSRQPRTVKLSSEITDLNGASLPRRRAEWFVAGARMLIAAAAGTALMVDHRPSEHLDLLAGGFVAYAALVLVLAWIGTPISRPAALAMHAVDLAFFGILARTTEVLPFFVLTTYVLLVATIRWGWRGTAWTGVTALALAVGLEIGSAPAIPIAVRGVYIGVLAAMIAFVGDYEERRREELARLASWPPPVSGDQAELLIDALRFIAGVLRSRRALLAWEEDDEPWLNLAYFDGKTVEQTREAPDFADPPVARALAAAAFSCSSSSKPSSTLTDARDGGEGWSGVPVHRAIVDRYGIGSVLSAPFAAGPLEGRLFALDGDARTVDDLVLARAAAAGVAARLQSLSWSQRFEASMLTRERLRVAHEIHDGVLQFLAGTALQIDSVRQSLPGDGAETLRNRLERIGTWIAEEQRQLRFFIGELRPGADPADGRDPAARLRSFVERIARHWEIRVESAIAPLHEMPDAYLREISRLVQEGIVNAARHADASLVRVSISDQAAVVRIAIEDDGKGFSFTGRWDMDELNRQKLGPVSLKERVSSLGGRLAIESRDAGARIEMTIPRNRDAP